MATKNVWDPKNLKLQYVWTFPWNEAVVISVNMDMADFLWTFDLFLMYNCTLYNQIWLVCLFTFYIALKKFLYQEEVLFPHICDLAPVHEDFIELFFPPSSLCLRTLQSTDDSINVFFLFPVSHGFTVLCHMTLSYVTWLAFLNKNEFSTFLKDLCFLIGQKDYFWNFLVKHKRVSPVSLIRLMSRKYWHWPRLSTETLNQL